MNDNKPQLNKKPRIKLPFDNKKSDIGEWAYDHRIGLLSMIIVYLVFAIVFVSSKIVVGSKPHEQGIYIDMEQLTQLEELRDQLQEEVNSKNLDQDWGSVKNQVSNENAINEDIRDDRATNTSEINDAARRAKEQMAANRAAYEKGLESAEALGKRSNSSSDDKQSENHDRHVEGNVTASYSFKNPTRHSRYLEIPAYTCQGGGEVILDVTLNRAGEVIDVDVAGKGGDRCMRESAIKSARNSIFDINEDAPSRHKGRITYIFIPQ